MQETGELFSPGVDPEELIRIGFLGEKITQPNLKKHKVFIQSTGSGARHLPGGSTLLYEVYL